MQIQITDLLESYIENIEDTELAVLLSGGVDSLSVAFAADRVGKRISTYSFRLDIHDNYDNEKAQQAANEFGWPHRECVVDTTNLVEDFLVLAKEYRCKKKTHFECVYPFLYVYPYIEERGVLTGWGADGYYGVSKKAHMHYKEPKEKFDEFRNDYFKEEHTAGLIWHIRLAKSWGKIHYTPYMDERVKNFFYEKDWYELNKPKQKHHVRTGYEAELNRIDGAKPHANLQLESGVDKVFENLLLDPQINYKRRTRVMDLCRDWKCYTNPIL